DHGALAAGILDAPTFRARLQAARVEERARLRQLLVVVRHGGSDLLERVREPARFGGLRGPYQDHEPHARLLRWEGLLSGLPTGLSPRTLDGASNRRPRASLFPAWARPPKGRFAFQASSQRIGVWSDARSLPRGDLSIQARSSRSAA